MTFWRLTSKSLRTSCKQTVSKCISFMFIAVRYVAILACINVDHSPQAEEDAYVQQMRA